MLGWLGDLRYELHSARKSLQFALLIRRGVEKQEPRYRRITRLADDPYEGYAPGSVEYAHIDRYVFASARSAGPRVLNIACGAGYGNAILAGPERTATGVDLYEEPLAAARLNFPGHRYLRADAQALSQLRDAEFDSVVSFETLEHLADPLRGIAEMKRVLRPGGVFIGSIPIQIYHHPGTNFSYRQALAFLRDQFPGCELFLQDNWRIADHSPAHWRSVRWRRNKYLLFRWLQPA